MSRRIENRIDVPGTPEQVWEAIATGPGIEAWFVPARVEDGRVELDMGSGPEDAGTVTEFSPPHRFAYLLNLRAHLTYFAGQRCATVMASGEGEWDAFVAALGLTGAAPGAHVAASGTPPLAGTVEHRGERELMLRLTTPAPGIALLYAYAWKDVMRTNVHLYLFEDSAAIAALQAPAWRDWMTIPSAT